ncbi:outer membrane beta-barrel protein [Spirosoma fluviale]|nr:outer membrane beta-barrel protein [Spirosoma fluviale]
MKRILFVLLTVCSLSATAQEYKPFKVNVSLGYAKALGEGLSGGFLFSVEPKYGLSDNFDLGVRLETAFIARGVTVTNGNTYTGNAGSFGSGLLTGTYLIGNGKIRPFVGLGAGIYSIGSSETFTVTEGQNPPENVAFTSDTKFGGMIRAGIKTGHFVAGVEYNAVPTTALKLSNTTIDSKNAYLGIKVGFDIGGGRL